jgi:hypothetical protein
MNVGDKFTKDGIVYVVTLIEVSKISMRVYMRSENDLLEEIERNNKLLQRPTMLAPDKGQAAVVEDESGSAPCG